jgi:hypothetical protein
MLTGYISLRVGQMDLVNTVNELSGSKEAGNFFTS